MNIMIGINDKYVFPAMVMLTSFCENNSFETHHVFILYDKQNLSTMNLIKLIDLKNQYDVYIHPIEFKSDMFKDYPMNFHLSIETYFRFMVQDVLPESVERVLWLDADMIVMKSMEKFYYQDFNGKSIVVCRTANNNAENFLKNLGLDVEVGYFNAGIILFNLKKLRKNISITNYFEVMERYKEKILWLDQDILNIIFANDKKLLETQIYNYTFLSGTKFSRKDLQKLEQDIYILHYIGDEKPWHITYKNKTIKYFRKYAKKQESLKDSVNFAVKYWIKRIRQCLTVK